MSKKFHDDDRTLEVQENGGKINLYIEGKINELGVEIAPSDAPALCLAILEAAGMEACHRDYESYDDGSPAHLQAVMYFLKQYNEAQAERAAAEADRVALQQEALALCNAYRKSYGASHITSFGEYSINEDDWLAVARAARELNKEAEQ